jgi:hypothetical protein
VGHPQLLTHYYDSVKFFLKKLQGPLDELKTILLIHIINNTYNWKLFYSDLNVLENLRPQIDLQASGMFARNNFVIQFWKMGLSYVISNFNFMVQGYSEVCIRLVRQEISCPLWKFKVPSNCLGSQ